MNKLTSTLALPTNYSLLRRRQAWLIKKKNNVCNSWYVIKSSNYTCVLDLITDTEHIGPI